MNTEGRWWEGPIATSGTAKDDGGEVGMGTGYSCRS